MSKLLQVPEKNAEGGPLLLEGEEVVKSCSSVRLIVGPDRDCGMGLLYLINRRIVWLSTEDNTKGFEVPFRKVTMHAVSR